jgi:Tfp pilus assembly protein PilX
MKNHLISMPPNQRQQGVVLAVALILLIVLTLLGISAMDTTILEHRLAKNNEERTHAFQTAEAGLLQARAVYASNSWIQNVVGNPERSTATPAANIDANAGLVNMSRKIDLQVSRTVPGSTVLEFKGYFTNQRGTADQAWSVTQTQSVYFETRTVGANLADNNSVQVSLRNGVRQGAPRAQ